MADQSFSGRLIIRRYVFRPHIIKHRIQNRPVLFHTEQTILYRDNAVCARRIKSGYRLSVPICPDRKLRLIAIAVRLLHTDDWLHDPVNKIRRKPTQTDEIAADFILFK